MTNRPAVVAILPPPGQPKKNMSKAKSPEPEAPAEAAPEAPPAPKRTPEEQAAKDARRAERDAVKAARESGAAAQPPPTQEQVQAGVKAPPSHKSLVQDVEQVIAKVKKHPATTEHQLAVRKLTAAIAALEDAASAKPAPADPAAPRW